MVIRLDSIFIVKCVGQGHRSQFEIRGDSALFRLKVKELSGIISSGNVGVCSLHACSNLR